MSVDVVIVNGKLVTSDSVIEADLVIDGGKFTAISMGQPLPDAKRVVDAEGNHVLPGVVDEHVHFQDMGRSAVADFIESSTAAAIGGVTTAMEMPLTIPATTTARAFEEKRKVAEEKFIVDFALYGGAVPGNLDELPKMVSAGAVGFKAMMAGSVPGLFEILDDGLLLDTFNVIGECNSIITVHAENEAVISNLESRLKAAGRTDAAAFFESRPVVQELEAITRAAMLAAETDCHLHVVHVSCPQGIDLISQRKEEGQRITAETGPHYLLLSEEDAHRLGPYVKFSPPARSKKETERLWKQLADGKVDTLGSDHGAHEKENKEKGWNNIWDAGNGALGVETMLPVMLSEGVNGGIISIQQLVSLISTNPAKLFGIYPQKGAIQVGSDADVVIVDLNREHTIKSENLHTRQKHTPFEGLVVRGMPVLTMVRGETVMENGKVVGKPGFGRFVRPVR
jgi:allantoinase